MKKITLALLLLMVVTINAQIDVSFETGVPAGWESSTNSLSTSNFHYKEGNSSLKWDWNGNDQITVANLQSQGLVPREVHSHGKRTFHMWVYNLVPLEGEKVVISFLDESDNEQYYYDFELNFKGWRSVSVHYRDEMSGSKSSSNLDKMIITAPNSGSGTLFFDRVDFTAGSFNSSSSTHMPYKVDRGNHWGRILYYTNLPKNYVGVEPTGTELSDLESLRAGVLTYIKGTAPSATDLSKADIQYNKFNIAENPDGTIKGVPIVYQGPILLADINRIIIVYARDFAYRNTADSRNKIMKLIRYTLDQGYNYGSVMDSFHLVGYNFRSYPAAVLLMENELKAEGLWEEAYSMVEWVTALDAVWDPAAEISSTDAASTRTISRYITCFFKPTKKEQVQYLKGLRDYIQNWATPHARVGEGVKTDYTGFHHGHYYPSRYVAPAYKNLAFAILQTKGTVFSPNEESKQVLAKASLVQRLSCNSLDLPMSIAGRGNPFTTIKKVSDALRDLSLSYTPVDQKLAGAYNRIRDESLSGVSKEVYPNGFWQLNYGVLGIYRNDEWVANIKGFNQYFLGQEIAKTASQYSRYTGYGSIEILYGAGNEASGKKIEGWDWNATPGATTIKLPWNLLRADGASDEKTNSEFVGALRFGTKSNYYLKDEVLLEGNMGLFSMDFRQKAITSNHNPSFKFKKTVFCIDDKMICLGTGINNNDSAHKTITTLFQNHLKTTNSAVFINGASENRFPLNRELDLTTNKQWLIDNVGTGYLMPKGNSNVVVTRMNQSSPIESGNGTSKSGDFTVAYLDHGVSPSDATYEYVIVPKTTNAKMEALATNIDDLYTVLTNNNKAQVIKSGDYEAYALFSDNLNLTGSLLKENTSRCMMVLKKDNAGENVTCSVSNPVIQFGADGIAVSEEVELSFYGNWDLDGAYEGVSIKESSNEKTILTVVVRNAAPTDFKLKLPMTLSLLNNNTLRANNESVEIYPIPFETSIYIDNSAHKYDRVIFYSLDGRELINRELLGNENIIKLSPSLISVPKGISIVKLLEKNKGNLNTVKIIRK